MVIIQLTYRVLHIGDNRRNYGDRMGWHEGRLLLSSFMLGAGILCDGKFYPADDVVKRMCLGA